MRNFQSATPALLMVLAFLLPANSNAQISLDLNKLLEAPGKVQRATTELPEDKEIELGRGLAGRLFGVMPLVRDNTVQQYVNDLGWWLVSHTERANLPWRFAVTDTATIGAFATPGGHIIVTRGLFALMQDEHQLAGVLAHEIAHVLRKHHVKEIMREAQTSLLGDVASTALSFLGGSSTESQVAKAIGKEAFGAGMELYGKGLSREDELEADAFGMVIAARGGYDPGGLGALLFTLDAMSPSTPSYELMHSTHPNTRDRINEIERAMEQGLEQYSGTLRDTGRFDSMKARLFR